MSVEQLLGGGGWNDLEYPREGVSDNEGESAISAELL